MDAQQEHDDEVAQRCRVSKGSYTRLKAALAEKQALAADSSDASDPIGQLVRGNSGLTSEKAEELAKESGF